MSKSKKNKVISITVYILILLLVIGAVGFFWYNTDGFKTKPRSLYITCDNKIVDSKVLTLKQGQQYDFGIVSLAELGDKSAFDYDIKIVPNSAIKSIRYLVHNVDYNFVSIGDYSTAFALNKGARGFTIRQDEWDIAKILSVMHDGAEVVFPESIEPGVYFCVVVTIKKKQIRFDLTAKLEGLEFDQGVTFQ